MQYTDINELNLETIKKEFQKEKSYSCIFPYINRDSEVFLSKFLKIILQGIHQERLYSYLEFVLNELSMNASQANSKRIYFLSKNLDINSPEQYNKGILNFRKDVFGNFKTYENLHIDQESFVKIKLAVENKKLMIIIQNNSPLVEQEKARIAQSLQIARTFNNLAEVLAHGFDTTKGGGFGLILVVLMLQKINLNEQSLVFQNGYSTCSTTVTIPLNLLSPDQSVIVAGEIVKEMNQMPQFPEGIANLQRELSDPQCSFSSISETIHFDTALTAEILRIANSPVYRTREEITDITAAVSLIGMLGLKAVLYNYGVNNVFLKRYNTDLIKEINDHSFYVALIASYLASYKKLGEISQDIYVAALLHDMGKIIVNSFQKEQVIMLEALCKEKHIPISILEDLTEGYNHGLIGSEIAKKWNFPEKYIDAIAYHHNPQAVADKYKALTYAVYLGNEIYYYNIAERDFNDINHTVLKFFGMDQKDSFTAFIDSVNNEGLGV